MWERKFWLFEPRGKTPTDFKISPQALYVLAMKLIKLYDIFYDYNYFMKRGLRSISYLLPVFYSMAELKNEDERIN